MPSAPTTIWSPDDVIVSWVAPDDGGSPITSYTIYIREDDQSTYSLQLSNCDGSDQVIRDAAQCTIPVSVLKVAPFDLPWGEHVFAKVLATNIYGSSELSLEGNGAMITTNPDPPINIAEDYSLRDPTTLGITWSPAAFTGGDVIIDYRINIAEQGGAFSVLASGLLTPDYTATGLTSGTTYEFKVESRNSYGYSDYSEVLTLLAAFKPGQPAAPTTTTINNQVLVEWTEPITNGSPITGYRIYI